MLRECGAMPTNDQQETDPLYEGLMLDSQCSPDALPFGVGKVQGPEQSLPFIEHNSCEMFNGFVASGDYSNVSQGIDGKISSGEVHGENPCKRVKWTDDMVKLLITALSYIGDYDAAIPHYKFNNGRFLIPKTGKWRAISNVMIQRGYHASSYQCEDKFNDLNKKYRRLNELLGRGTACQVVENPKLIGSMDLSNEEVAEVMKILSCKQLCYREMCSYNNRNRLFLPHDQSVQNLLKLALKGKGNCFQEAIHSGKKMKESEIHEVAGPKSSLDCNRRSNFLPSECEKSPNKWISSRLLDLEEQKLLIQEQRLELEKLLIEGQQEDLELEKMRLENKMIKLGNQRLALKIRQQMSVRKVLRGKRE